MSVISDFFHAYGLLVASVIPILWLVLTLGTSALRAHTASLTTWALTVVIALTAFGQNPVDVAGATLEGIVFGFFPILWVIIAAIYTYKLSLHTGAMAKIRAQLSGISEDPRIQVLILAWGFGGFLEAVSGYGTSVAIPAGILIAFGFEPIFAAVICLLANTVPTAFGAVGIAVTTLARVTDLPVADLSWTIALQLSPFILLMPFVLVLVTARSLKGMRGVWGVTFVSALSFVVPQLLAARFLGEMLPTLVGSLCSMGSTILYVRAFHSRTEKYAESKRQAEKTPVGAKRFAGFLEAFNPWLPYSFLIVLILLASPLFPSISHALGQAKSSLLLYPGKGGSPLVIKWLSTPGTLIFAAAVLGSLLQGVKPILLVTAMKDTVSQMKFSILTVTCIVAVAKVMGYSGMVNTLALTLAGATGGVFPLLSPFIGMLGTFITGSDTSSNVLFGSLQTQVARNIGVSPVWLAAANTAGATAGKMISPQSIAVATAAAGLTGMEGKIFRKTVAYAAFYIVILGLGIWAGSVLL